MGNRKKKRFDKIGKKNLENDEFHLRKVEKRTVLALKLFHVKFEFLVVNSGIEKLFFFYAKRPALF